MADGAGPQPSRRRRSARRAVGRRDLRRPVASSLRCRSHGRRSIRIGRRCPGDDRWRDAAEIHLAGDQSGVATARSVARNGRRSRSPGGDGDRTAPFWRHVGAGQRGVGRCRESDARPSTAAEEAGDVHRQLRQRQRERRQRREARGVDPDGRRRSRARDCVRQCGELAAGALDDACAGDRDSVGRWGDPLADRESRS